MIEKNFVVTLLNALVGTVQNGTLATPAGPSCTASGGCVGHRRRHAGHDRARRASRYDFCPWIDDHHLVFGRNSSPCGSCGQLRNHYTSGGTLNFLERRNTQLLIATFDCNLTQHACLEDAKGYARRRGVLATTARHFLRAANRAMTASTRTRTSLSAVPPRRLCLIGQTLRSSSTARCLVCV
jgi:hypothetical protein